MSDLGGTTALVTGASRGVGRAVALGLAEAGADLVLSSRGGRALREVAEATGGDAVEADLERLSEVDRLVGAAGERFGGPPEVLVNAAGCFDLAPVVQLPLADFERHLRVNLRAPFALVRALLPGMLARGSGHLLHVGSVAGRRAYPENAAYSASKYGLRGFHEVLRLELAGTGVRTTLVEPGPVDTGAWDGLEARLGRDLPARDSMLRPEAVADAVLACLRLGRRGASTDVLVLPG